MHRAQSKHPIRPYRIRERLPVVQKTPGRIGPEPKRILQILMILLVFVASGVPDPCTGETRQLFRIGTGGLLGVYHPIGKLIAQGLTSPQEGDNVSEAGAFGIPGYIGIAQSSGGSVANVRALASGEIEAGLVQADVASWAFRGEHLFSGDETVRVVRAVASLYPEKLHIVMRRDADIRSVSDLRGKHISIDEVGSGTLAIMRIVLDAYGLSEKDLSPVYLKPEFTEDKIRKGELQGFVLVGGIPAKAVAHLSDVGITFVPIAPEIASQIHTQFPYLVPGKIPASAYPGIPDTPTLEVHALLTVSVAMSEDLAYQLTAALWNERTLSLLRDGHPQGKAITLETALTGISIPLHRGAERFYREQGMLPKGTPSP